MKSKSLKAKIFLVGAIPFLAFIVSMLVYPMSDNYFQYAESKSVLTKLNVIIAASKVVHESQIERGKTAGFLSGGVPLAALKKQREKNDKEIEKLKKVISISTFSQDYQDDLYKFIAKYSALRKDVSAKKISLPLALKTYTSIIKRLLQIKLDVARSATIPVISTKLKSFRILEDTKESGGKLRANVSSILSKNSPIPDKKFHAIIKLKSGVEEGLVSSGLSLDPKMATMVKGFQESSEWKEVSSIFATVLKNADKGDYNKDSNAFFQTISVALGKLAAIITYKKEDLNKTILEIKSQALNNVWKALAEVVLTTIALLVALTFMSNSITKKVRSIIDVLNNSSSELTKSSDEVTKLSGELSSSSSESASFLQETVSSLDEVQSMVSKNADNTKKSTEVSQKSKTEAELGKQQINQMIKSIEEIADSNQDIMHEMQNNNEQISKITALISEIEEKTKVINDIVFQTKLLSFNASVEAARAGEHGKGFAVVAEEVGNLASMSGKAALEISEMLESSIKQVNDIVDSSKSKVDKILNQGKEKVESGTNVAINCSTSLDSIIQNVNSVNEIVNEISIASNEQATGVGQINQAMQQLDQLSHKNSAVADQTAKMADSLNTNVEDLNHSIEDLIELVEGQ